jgi:transaldolase
MKATTKLHGLGQSLWLDNITRAILDSAQLQRYIGEFSVTGLTSSSTILREGGQLRCHLLNRVDAQPSLVRA